MSMIMNQFSVGHWLQIKNTHGASHRHDINQSSLLTVYRCPLLSKGGSSAAQKPVVGCHWSATSIADRGHHCSWSKFYGRSWTLVEALPRSWASNLKSALLHINSKQAADDWRRKKVNDNAKNSKYFVIYFVSSRSELYCLEDFNLEKILDLV